MEIQIYAVFDEKAKSFHQPFYQQTDGLVVRMMLETVKDPNSTISKYKEDFTIFHIGVFDDQKGMVVPRKTLRSLGNVLQIVNNLERKEVEERQKEKLEVEIEEVEERPGEKLKVEIEEIEGK